MLQYQLELACFLASRSVYRNDSSQKWDSWCTSSSSDGQADPDHRDPFVANIVLEQLGSRSPIQVGCLIFLPQVIEPGCRLVRDTLRLKYMLLCFEGESRIESINTEQYYRFFFIFSQTLIQKLRYAS